MKEATFETIYKIHTVTRLLPHYFSQNCSSSRLENDLLLNTSVVNIDFSSIFWIDKLDQQKLIHLLNSHNTVESGEESTSTKANFEIDRIMLTELPRAKEILGNVDKHMPRPDELWYCFRVISHCSSFASRYETGFTLHLARGLITNEYKQYDLNDILRVAANPNTTSVGRYFNLYLNEQFLNKEKPSTYIFNIRNDGELNQVLLLCGIVKSLDHKCITILEAAGANEQFDFGQWVPLFNDNQQQLGKLLDYYLPRQDYKQGLQFLIRSLRSGFAVHNGEHGNIYAYHSNSLGSNCVVPATINHSSLENVTSEKVDTLESRNAIDVSFEQYLRSRPVFMAAGLRTINARLSPSRCHWAACKFCTINSQHILPRASQKIDSKTLHHIQILFEVLREKNVESLILMDEALPPTVLIHFSRLLLEHKIKLVYRARARFTSDFTCSAANILYASGCRYLGMGLEAKSERINRLVNKHMGDSLDYQGIIDNLESAGIRTHIYCIMAFPTETLEEIQETHDFLLSNIQKQRYLTVSANTFYLMRGSGIAATPGLFGISQVSSDGDISLTLNFTEDSRLKGESFASNCAKRIYQSIFLPHANDPVAAEAFWHFVDQTGIFYLQKVMYRDNPYHLLATASQRPLQDDFTSHKFFLSASLKELTTLNDGHETVFFDVATFNYVKIPNSVSSLLKDYNSSIVVQENIERLFLDNKSQELALSIFPILVKMGFFIPSDIEELLNSKPDPFTDANVLEIENIAKYAHC